MTVSGKQNIEKSYYLHPIKILLLPGHYKPFAMNKTRTYHFIYISTW